MKRLLPLLWLPLLAPLNLAPATAGRQAADAEPEVALAPLTADDMVGRWYASLEMRATEPRVRVLERNGLGLEDAVKASYEMRLVFEQDGTCKIGRLEAGESVGDALPWEARARRGGGLLVLLGGPESSTVLTVERAGDPDNPDKIVVSGDELLSGAWTPYLPSLGGIIDMTTKMAAESYLEARLALAELEAQFVETEQQLLGSAHQLVGLVKLVCVSEQQLEDLSRELPIRGDAPTELRAGMLKQETILLTPELLIARPVPVPPKHRAEAKAFDEAWLSGAWVFALDRFDWDTLMPRASEQDRQSVRGVLATREMHFDMRGLYSDAFGEGEERGVELGYYALVPGAENWVHLAVLSTPPGEQPSPDNELFKYSAAYRVGDVLWVDEDGDEPVPFRRKQ